MLLPLQGRPWRRPAFPWTALPALGTGAELLAQHTIASFHPCVSPIFLKGREGPQGWARDRRLQDPTALGGGWGVGEKSSNWTSGRVSLRNAAAFTGLGGTKEEHECCHSNCLLRAGLTSFFNLSFNIDVFPEGH